MGTSDGGSGGAEHPRSGPPAPGGAPDTASPPGLKDRPGWRSPAVWRKRLVKGWSARPRTWGALGLGIGATAFAVFIGWVWNARYLAFQTYAWDLGIYNQGFSTALFDHLLFYYTADLPSGTTSTLVTHFSPVFFGILPLYALDPGPPALLAIQAVALALGAVPLYFLARFYLRSDAWALFLSGFYLLTPLTVGTGWYDFHPESFLPVCMLTAFYFFARQRFWPFVIAWVLTLSVIETAAPLLLVFAIAVIIGALWKRYRRHDLSAWPECRLATLGLGIAAGWLVLSAVVVLSLTPTGGTFGITYAGNWSVLGASTIYDVVPYALLHPTAAYAALSYDSAHKLVFVLLLFGAFAFLPFWGQKRYLLMVATWLVLALLSNNRPYYVFGDQYLGYVLAPLVAGTVTGIYHILHDVRLPSLKRARVPGTVVGLVAALLVTTAVVSPFLPTNGLTFGIPHGIPAQTAQDDALHEVIGTIPSNASILTTPAIFPEVSSRPNAYVDPISSFFAGNLTFSGVLNRYVNESRYVLVDFLVDYSNAILVERYANLSGFGIEAAVDGAYLYERGWSGPPAWWVPYQQTVAPKALTIVSGYLEGGLLVHPASSPPYTEIWTGPGIQALPPGRYAANATVRLSSPSPGALFRFEFEQQQIEVIEQEQALSGGRDYSFQFVSSPYNVSLLASAVVNVSAPISFAPFNVTLTAQWSGPGFLLLPGISVASSATIVLYSIQLEQVAP